MNDFEIVSSEAVSEGHPDKICDQIADRILDVCLEQDSNSHVACEVFITNEFVLLGGEITSKAKLNYEKIVRDTLFDIGYIDSKIGINYKTCLIENKIKNQSPEINKTVKNKNTINAGDQGIVFGYATNETKNLMPISACLANEIMKLANDLRKNGSFKFAQPDMKTQVTFDYKKNKITNILISVQHDKNFEKKTFEEYITTNILFAIAKKFNLNLDFKVLINTSGQFTIGGPAGDTGLTGRKLMCDSYGCCAHHGGGAYSGKDATKIDRSGAYYARYIAKNLVAAGISNRIEIQITYAIGLSKPLNISFNTFNTENYQKEIIKKIIKLFFDASVESIINSFSLNKPNFKYQKISNYGHFGRLDLELPWEKTDKVEKILFFLDSIKKNKI